MSRIIFVESLAGEGLSEDAINQRWKRFKDKLGVDVPKSDNPESQAKAKARAEATAKKRAEFASKSIDQLKADIKNLTANASMANLKKAGEVQREIDTRFKEENKGQEEYRKDLIKALTEWLKEQSTNDLATMALNYGLTV
jgi:crotonobetainyl-CoA:carnitine CoA-transferase CaiB-like acyl-CoA transferase